MTPNAQNAPRSPRPAKPSAERSATMRAVKSRDTAPELAVRRILREIAPGYRLHRADLPGKPDIVYKLRTAASGAARTARASSATGATGQSGSSENRRDLTY